ncbi:MAG TPA: alpha/beta hydrolase [Pyrinomonadaceae bacterium]|jgi:hypothetical protein
MTLHRNLCRRPLRTIHVDRTTHFIKPTLITRERLIAVAAGIVFGSLVLTYGLRILEAAMTFHPVRISGNINLPKGAEDVWLNTSDGVRLHAWFFKSQRQSADATVIYFHGNGGNITNVGWVAENLANRGFNTLLLDYRGYGQSQGEARSESDLYADGDAAIAYVVDQRGVSLDQVVLYGQSLGTTVAVDLAARHQCAALILESGLSSASSIATRELPWLPRWLHFLGKNRFESAHKLKNVTAPVLITHGDPDPVISTDEARTLFASANEPKKLLIYRGVGHNVFGSLGDRYLDVVEQFVREALVEKHKVSGHPTERS